MRHTQALPACIIRWQRNSKSLQRNRCQPVCPWVLQALKCSMLLWLGRSSLLSDHHLPQGRRRFQQRQAKGRYRQRTQLQEFLLTSMRHTQQHTSSPRQILNRIGLMMLHVIGLRSHGIVLLRVLISALMVCVDAWMWRPG